MEFVTVPARYAFIKSRGTKGRKPTAKAFVIGIRRNNESHKVPRINMIITPKNIAVNLPAQELFFSVSAPIMYADAANPSI